MCHVVNFKLSHTPLPEACVKDASNKTLELLVIFVII